MTDCIFCKIVSGQIPCEKLYEDDKTFAFLDIKPANEGHTLVIHKHHHADLFDTPVEDVADIFRTVKKVGAALLQAVGADGLNIGMNNKPAAGQVVFHAHVHVIPRYSGDGLKMWPHKETTAEARLAVAKKVLAALRTHS